ncbi:MAG: FIST C-terminal domain-containing protein [Desulfotomaculum sp.]|nr:FIST C-terminal domain-containing protein [Desulfotomaculum sp.]
MYHKIKFYSKSSFLGLNDFLSDLITEDTTGIILFIGEKTLFNSQQFFSYIKKYNVPICGGIFPGLLYNNRIYTSGILGISFKVPFRYEAVHNIPSLTKLPMSVFNKNQVQTCLVLHDGLTCGIDDFLSKIFSSTTYNTKFIGGGAGRLSLKRKPSLFTKDSFWNDGALIICIDTPVGIGVGHGWEYLHGPLVANKVDGFYLQEINWEPAWNYYREIVESEINCQLTADNFFDIAKKFPLGMIRTDGTLIVRDTVGIHNGSLRLIGEVPQNSVLAVLHGSSDNLIAAAGDAVVQAYNDYEKDTANCNPSGMLVIDCISRSLYLQENTNDEFYRIKICNKHNLPTAGFFSLGEVASLGDRYLELFNKTIVVGVG